MLRTSIKIISFIFFLFITTQTFAITASDISGFVTDASVTTSIRSKILVDNSLSNLKIDVGTVDGIVSFAGTVDSDTEASALIQIASSTEGVREINTSKLTVVKSKQPISDLIITAKVKGLFARYNLFGSQPMSINVETNNGVVYLTGTATSKKQADDAIEIAKSVNGVSKVESRLKGF